MLRSFFINRSTSLIDPKLNRVMNRRKYFLGSSRTKKYELSQNANELREESVERIFLNVEKNKR